MIEHLADVRVSQLLNRALMLSQARQVLLEYLFQRVLVHELHQKPESGHFTRVVEKTSSDEGHALDVADLWLVVGVSSEDALEGELD